MDTLSVFERSNGELTGGVRMLKVVSQDKPRMDIAGSHAFKSLFVGHAVWSLQRIGPRWEGATPYTRRRGAAHNGAVMNFCKLQGGQPALGSVRLSKLGMAHPFGHFFGRNGRPRGSTFRRGTVAGARFRAPSLV